MAISLLPDLPVRVQKQRALYIVDGYFHTAQPPGHTQRPCRCCTCIPAGLGPQEGKSSLQPDCQKAAPTLRSLMPEPLAADTGFAALHITLRQGADVRSKYLFVRAHRGKTQVRLPELLAPAKYRDLAVAECQCKHLLLRQHLGYATPLVTMRRTANRALQQGSIKGPSHHCKSCVPTQADKAGEQQAPVGAEEDAASLSQCGLFVAGLPFLHSNHEAVVGRLFGAFGGIHRVAVGHEQVCCLPEKLAPKFSSALFAVYTALTTCCFQPGSATH